jgi:hypothetical protein
MQRKKNQKKFKNQINHQILKLGYADKSLVILTFLFIGYL